VSGYTDKIPVFQNTVYAPVVSVKKGGQRVPSDEAAIVFLLSRYCHAMDRASVADLLDCFAADGVFAYYPAGAAEPLFRLEGGAAIEGWFGEHRARTPLGTQTHVTVNPSVVVDGDGATATSTFLSLRAQDGGIVVASTGRYADRLERGADGRWRFAERVTHGDMPRPA
jgi:ketosteroid isomerase-like protein